MSNDADSHKLLAVVPSIHHEGICKALNDGAIGLAEALDGIAACGVRDVDWGADLDVIAVGEDLVSQNTCKPIVQGHSGQKRAPNHTTSILHTLASCSH